MNGKLDVEQPSRWLGLTEVVPLRIAGIAEEMERFKGLVDEIRISNIARP